MKQKILMLLAAVLLGSASAFAQSGNSESLKGDVNGDGRVDVADITAVVDIVMKGEAGYFYFGTTQPTAENYQTIPGVVASYMSIGEALGTTASVAAGETLYMLCPAGWMKGENVIIEDEGGNSVSFSDDVDNVTISGYAIYKTQIWNDAATITLKASTYDFYFGQATEDQIQSQSYINSLINNKSGKPTTLTFVRGYNVLIVPKEWGLPTIKDPAGFDFSEYDASELGIINPTNKLVYVYECSGTSSLGTIESWTPVEDQTTAQQNNYFLGATSKESFALSDLNEYVATKPSSITVPNTTDKDGEIFTVWIYPAAWGRPISAISSLSHSEEVQAFNYGDIGVPEGFEAMWIDSGSECTYTLTWGDSSNNYFLGATSKASFALSDLNQYVASRPSSITVPNTIDVSGTELFTSWIYPESWGRPISAISSLSHYEEVQSFNYGELGVPAGYIGMWVDSTSECTYTLTWGD